MLIAIDPGTTSTGWAVMNRKDVVAKGVSGNEEFIRLLKNEFRLYNKMVYEMIASYGMPVGHEVFDTCVWIGRFVEAFGHNRSFPIFRKDVKRHLCGNHMAKDSNVMMAIIDMYDATGGGKRPQVGTKAKPGPLFGVATHVWPAIGVGLTYQDISK